MLCALLSDYAVFLFHHFTTTAEHNDAVFRPAVVRLSKLAADVRVTSLEGVLRRRLFNSDALLGVRSGYQGPKLNRMLNQSSERRRRTSDDVNQTHMTESQEQ